MSIPRSRATVSARASDLRACGSRPVFSSSPVELRKRRLNSSSRKSRTFSTSCSSFKFRTSFTFTGCSLLLSRHDLRADRQLVAGQSHRVARELLRDTRELEHHAAGLDHGNPPLRRALPRAHPGLGRLLCDGLVRKDVDPDLAPALALSR